MSNIPTNLLYTSTHEWILPADDGTATIGLTDHAQAALGDVTYVQIPAPETILSAGKTCGVIESVKAASDIYAPVSGRVIARNEALDADPSLVNRDPYGAGWLFRVKAESPLAPGPYLLDAESYRDSAH